MKCKDCMKKDGYENKAVGAHTVRIKKCTECENVKPIWPMRHYRKLSKQMGDL